MRGIRRGRRRATAARSSSGAANAVADGPARRARTIARSRGASGDRPATCSSRRSRPRRRARATVMPERASATPRAARMPARRAGASRSIGGPLSSQSRRRRPAQAARDASGWRAATRPDASNASSLGRHGRGDSGLTRCRWRSMRMRRALTDTRSHGGAVGALRRRRRHAAGWPSRAARSGARRPRRRRGARTPSPDAPNQSAAARCRRPAPRTSTPGTGRDGRARRGVTRQEHALAAVVDGPHRRRRRRGSSHRTTSSLPRTSARTGTAGEAARRGADRARRDRAADPLAALSGAHKRRRPGRSRTRTGPGARAGSASRADRRSRAPRRSRARPPGEPGLPVGACGASSASDARAPVRVKDSPPAVARPTTPCRTRRSAATHAPPSGAARSDWISEPSGSATRLSAAPAAGARRQTSATAAAASAAPVRQHRRTSVGIEPASATPAYRHQVRAWEER